MGCRVCRKPLDGYPVVKVFIMVIEREMESSVSFTDAHGDHIVRIVPRLDIVSEDDRFPSPGWKSPPAYGDIAFGEVAPDHGVVDAILVTVIAHNRVVLMGSEVQGSGSVLGLGAVSHEVFTHLGDGGFAF